MSEFEDKIKTDSEDHLFETPTAKVRNDLSRRKEPQSAISSGLNHVTPPHFITKMPILSIQTMSIRSC